MWLVIITCLTLQIHAFNQYFYFFCLMIMFYLTKESCSVDVLKIWKNNFLLVLLADLVRGHWERLPASITWESDTVWWWYPEQKIGYENSVRYKISLPEMKLPSPRTDPSSSASPGLNRRAHWAVSAIVSLASHPFLCIPELDTIQWMKNSTIMNQNKRALSHLVFFSLFPPNANDCVCSC